MLRVAEPVGAQALNQRGVSPKIRSLQDRLMDSLPTDGAWECLSPAQREAILSLHHNRLFGNNHNNNSGNNNNHHQASTNNHHHNHYHHHHQNSGHNHHGGQHSQHPDDGGNRSRRLQSAVPGLGRCYTRSRSYEDKLESETDDSGARGLGGGSGTSSGSHNSHEDDSSDPGVNRSSKPEDGAAPKVGGGLFAKANLKSSSVDRANFRKPGEKGRLRNHGVLTTNGFGNVNKMISKQMNKSPGITNSNITLDCRNVQGEKRRRSCIFADDEDPFRNIDQDPEIIPTVRPTHRTSNNFTPNGRDVPVPSDRAGLSRRKILNKYETEVPSPERESNGSDDLPSARNPDYKLTIMRATPSSEEYDSGVNFRLDSSQDTLESLQQDPSKPLCRIVTSVSASNLHFNSMPYGGGRFYDNNLGTAERHSLAHNSSYGADVAAGDRDVSRAPRSPLEFLRPGGKEELVSVNAEASKSEQTMRCKKEGLASPSNNIPGKTREKSNSSVASPNNARNLGGLRHSASDNLNAYVGNASKYGIGENYIKELKLAEGDLTRAVKQGSKGTSGSSCEPLKSNLKSSYGDKMNSSLDYRSTMNQDANNRYSNNWNEMILNNQVNLKYNKYDACNDATRQGKPFTNSLAKSSENLSTKTHHQNFGFTNARTPTKNEVNFLHNELERPFDGRDCRLSPKKYNRSKSLDRKYLDDSSEDESDFEARRRFERERRYARNPEWDALRLRNYENRLRRGYALANNSHNNSSNNKGFKHGDGGRQNKVNWEIALTTDIALQHRRSSTLMADRPPRLKARSAWDLSRFDDDDSRGDEELLQKCRVGLRNRWQNIDKNDENDRDLHRTEDIDLIHNARSDGHRDYNDGIGSRFDNRRTPIGRRKVERLKNLQREEAVPEKANEAVNALVAGSASYLGKFEQWETSEVPDASHRMSEFHLSRNFSKEQWRRRSCDFELDGPSVPSEEPLSLNPLDLDRKRWYRRSCDLDLDFDQYYQQNKERTSDYDLDHDLLSRTLQQFQSLPPYQEGLPLPEEVILDKKRCVGRREELRSSRIVPSPPNPTLTQETSNTNVPLSQEEILMLDSGHEMLLLDKSKLPALNRVDGRSKSRMEDIFRFQDELLEDSMENSKNISGNGRAERPKTSIGQYGKEKRERNSSTQHGLKGKLRLFKSILSF